MADSATMWNLINQSGTGRYLKRKLRERGIVLRTLGDLKCDFQLVKKEKMNGKHVVK